MPPKLPFDIDVALHHIQQVMRPYPKAAMFALRDEGYSSAFEQLVACILSIRTLDEVSIGVARDLFARARTPREIARLGIGGIDALIRASTFHSTKARSIHRIAVETEERHGGKLPCDFDTLVDLPGVGPKCANLALGVACGQPAIAVDIHVHRVTNRWGYVQAATPEKTMAALEAKLPRRHWIRINELLVPFGKHVCTGSRPACASCPVLDMCRQVGVTETRGLPPTARSGSRTRPRARGPSSP